MAPSSIIVPAHNNAAVIRDTLLSIERSLSYLRHCDPKYDTFTCDVVVIDDGSSDDSHLIVSEFARDRSHYTIIPQKTVHHTRSPGNALDRQYEKFQVAPRRYRRMQSEEREFQIELANLISQYHLIKLELAKRSR